MSKRKPTQEEIDDERREHRRIAQAVRRTVKRLEKVGLVETERRDGVLYARLTDKAADELQPAVTDEEAMTRH